MVAGGGREEGVCGDGGGSDGQRGEENGPRVPGLALPALSLVDCG